MYRIAIPHKDYVFQKEDIVICVLPDIQKYAKPLLVKIVDVENNNNEKALRFSF